MKYGLLMHKPTANLGDDIQSYAIAQFLPQIDYFVDRETINTFESQDREPVATIMAAWWMWSKWNWPPSKYIYPHFVGMHYSDNEKANQAGCPVDYKFLSELGADYLNAYGPVGCRDYFTKKKLQENGVNAEFSGCITLTLPQQPKKEVEEEYICLVDVQPRVGKRIRKKLANSNLKIINVTHDLDMEEHQKLSWDERKKIVEAKLTLYQNAKCVLTRRLHCALPCLAMNVPTLLIIPNLQSIRFVPYYDWLHYCTPKAFLKGEYVYDPSNPPANKTGHLETRNTLIASCKNFVEQTKDINASADELNKMPHSDKEIQKWRNKQMKETLTIWCKDTKKNLSELKKVAQEYKSISELPPRPAFRIKYSLCPIIYHLFICFLPTEQQNKLLNWILSKFLSGSRKIFNEIKIMKKQIQKAKRS